MKTVVKRCLLAAGTLSALVAFAAPANALIFDNDACLDLSQIEDCRSDNWCYGFRELPDLNQYGCHKYEDYPLRPASFHSRTHVTLVNGTPVISTQ
ncbi:hypothetical protein GCM10010174_80500 [Kutzneria viridogrisea]|uniref:Uncharacterized protein n=1 Tax=Kutzneria viridogrisea TaxID=47990 RepID=A0ABR6BZX3_9PSEU|nr:hypothetical protein [Kutzneria viridogrisea]